MKVAVLHAAGEIRIEERDRPHPGPREVLVQVTAVVSWTCAAGAEESSSPGACSDGSAKTSTLALRAHGNHNPQHGGLFFMAADNTHHLEGAYLASGMFRMYFYDEFTKPQKLAAVKNYKATLNVKDAKTGKDTVYSLARTCFESSFEDQCGGSWSMMPTALAAGSCVS